MIQLLETLILAWVIIKSVRWTLSFIGECIAYKAEYNRTTKEKV